MARRTRPSLVVRLMRAGPARTALALAGLALIVLWGGPRALVAVGDFLIVESSLSKADAIVVLSGDGGARLEEGVDLFNQSYAPFLVLSGAGQQGSPPAAEVMEQQAIELGIPGSAILVADRSTSTREDALYTRELMVAHALRSAILVTSAYHERRATLTFKKAFEGSGISVISYPVQDEEWRPDNWWRSRRTIELTVSELLKLVYYKLARYL